MHYAILVLGGNVEDQLAPFSEERDVAPYKRREHQTQADRQKELDWAKTYTAEKGLPPLGPKPSANDLPAVAAYLNRFHGCTPDGTADFPGTIDYECLYVDADGLFTWSTSNPNGKWDWYSIGGRWRGWLLPKSGVVGLKGEMGVPELMARRDGKDLEEPEGYDALRKCQVDFDRMRSESEATARKNFAIYAEAVAGTPEVIPWDHFETLAEAGTITWDAAREQYRAQPRIKAIDTKAVRDALGWMISPDDFAPTAEAHAARARKNAFVLYGLLADGVWHERETWDGHTFIKKDRDAWADEFNGLVDAAGDDTMLTVVDIHN